MLVRPPSGASFGSYAQNVNLGWVWNAAHQERVWLRCGCYKGGSSEMGDTCCLPKDAVKRNQVYPTDIFIATFH